MRENKQSEVSSLGRIMGPSNTSRSRPWGRNETSNSVQLGEMAVGSVLLCRIDHGIRRHSGRNSANWRSGR